MRWYWWVLGGAVLIAGAWWLISEQKEEAEKMQRVRDAKAVKKFSTLTDNNHGSVRIDETENKLSGDESPA